jgi:hypothetical protein
LGLRLASVLGIVNHGLHRLCGFLELGLKEIVVLGSVWFESGGQYIRSRGGVRAKSANELFEYDTEYN